MKIAIASDHAGYTVKEQIYNWLNSKQDLTVAFDKTTYQKSLQKIDEKFTDIIITDIIIQDLGVDTYNKVDYPDYANKLCSNLLLGHADIGILICGTGIGMSMAANRFPNIRAALCKDVESAKLSRQHNNANVLCLGARNTDNIIEIVQTFLETSFTQGRHSRRISKFSV